MEQRAHKDQPPTVKIKRDGLCARSHDCARRHLKHSAGAQRRPPARTHTRSARCPPRHGKSQLRRECSLALAPRRAAARREGQRATYLERNAGGGHIEVGLIHELADGLDELLEQTALGEASFEHSAKGAPSDDHRYTVIQVGHRRAQPQHATAASPRRARCDARVGAARARARARGDARSGRAWGMGPFRWKKGRGRVEWYRRFSRVKMEGRFWRGSKGKDF